MAHRDWTSAHKLGVLSLVDRTTGTMRSFTFDKFRADEVYLIVLANLSPEARLMTDQARMYSKLSTEFAEHGTTLTASSSMSTRLTARSKPTPSRARSRHSSAA